MSYLIPLFPLPETVLFPRTRMRLHIFEPRYRAMVESVMQGDQRFAICHLREGYQNNYFGHPPIHRMGTTARVLFADRLNDGRWNLAVEGVERIRIEMEVQESPFRVAKVSPLLEEVPPEHRDETFRLARELSTLAEAVADKVPDTRRVLSNLMNTHQHPAIVGDLIAGALISDPYARQSLLAEPNVLRRLKLIRVQMDHLIHELRENGISLKDLPKD